MQTQVVTLEDFVGAMLATVKELSPLPDVACFTCKKTFSLRNLNLCFGCHRAYCDACPPMCGCDAVETCEALKN
jgi:hypothetical protein